MPVGIAAIGCLVSLYISLGPFWPLAIMAGSAVSVIVTTRVWRNTRPSVVASAEIAGAYILVQVALLALTQRESREIFLMQSSAARTSGLPAEVRLAFREEPGSFIGIRSPELAAYLDTSSASEVPAEFTVSRDLGCVRGFTPVRVGPVMLRPTTTGYFGSRNPARLPFMEPWWCP